MPPPSRHTMSFKIGDQPVPGYRLARELGRGTFGVVWLAVTDNGFERALKVVNLEQKGGKKEFRALRLIKDRKILHGNLLTLIDYWLLDRDGTILSTPNNITLDSQRAPPKSGSAISPGTAVSGDRTAKVQVKNLPGGIKGTMMPGNEFTEENFSVRDTFQQVRTDTQTSDENSNAIWLVVAMELGHKTLHDRQKEHTHVVNAKTQTKVAPKGRTHVDAKDGTAGSNTVADRKTQQQGNEDDDLAPLPAEEVLPYMEQAARGLDYLHKCEIVHRDVKPQNIMLVGDVAKVCDYGLASELGDIRATTNAFTLPYAAPEAINKNQPTPASDQYSLAVTYVELRTGRWPFISNTSTAVYAAKDTGVHHLKFVRNRNVRAVLKKALSKKPQDRYPSCGEFVKQLAKAEATKFNLFATAQAALAILAIVTVLLAAAATHPDVRKSMLASLPEEWRPPVAEPFDLAGFQERLQGAESLLAKDSLDDRAEALQRFSLLHNRLAQLPKEQTDLRDRTLLGLARAQAGQNNYLSDAEQQQAVMALVTELSASVVSRVDEQYGLQAHYLRVISKQEPPHKEIGPDSVVATNYLTNWERQIWREALVFNSPEAPSIVKGSLENVIAWRKKGDLINARQELIKLQGELKGSAAVADGLLHRIRLEELHLKLSDEAPDHQANLEALLAFINQNTKVEEHLLDRAHLLRFLVHHKAGDEFSYRDPEIARTIQGLRPELFATGHPESLHFTKTEAGELSSLKNRIKDQIQAEPMRLPTEGFTALRQLWLRRDGFNLLCQRLRSFLPTPAMKDAPFERIRDAAADLQAYVDTEYQISALTGAEQQAAAREDADLKLEVGFANPAAQPAEVLNNYRDKAELAGNTVKWFERLLARAKDEKWTEAAEPPLLQFISSPSNDLAAHPKFAEWQRGVEALALRATWQLDPNPKDVTAIPKILTKLTAVGDGKGPLSTLLKVECEILTTSAPSAEKTREWEASLERAAREAGSDAELQAYADFVHARLHSSSKTDSDQDEAAKLIERVLTQSPLPPWLSKSRLNSAGEVLSVAALRELGIDDESVLRFAELSLPNSPQLERWQAATTKAGLNLPALQAVAAITHATQSGKTEWTEIQRVTKAAQQDSQTAALFEQHQAGRLLDYVSAWSALQATPAATAPAPEIVQAFHRLLLAKQAGSYLFFEYAGGSGDDDASVLQNIVNPVLNHLRRLPANAPPAALPPKELAFLWGAKGRLLQRNPYIIRVDPSKEEDERDSTVVALEQANLAFDRARKLDDQVEYLVGYCRTLAALPENAKTRGTTLKDITDLLGKRTAEERQSSVGMRFLVAYTKRLNAYGKDSKDEIKDAERLYRELLGELPAKDPWGLVPLCREGLSDIHLRLAFLHESITAKEVRQLLAKTEPDPNTKAHHLYWAVKYGEAAIETSHKSQNENAHIALANAYEDYAYYLGIHSAYETSQEHFVEGIESARNRGLSLAKARLNYGRCLFRQATDHLVESKPADRQKLLADAAKQLEEALKSGTLRPEDEVESYFWLAKVKRAVGDLSPPQTRIVLYDEAVGINLSATEAAAKHKLIGFQMVAMSIESDASLVLYNVYDAPATKDIIRMPIRRARAEALDEAGYQLFAAHPDKVKPRFVNDLAGNAAEIWSRDRAKRQRWLSGTPAIQKQWNADNEWRFAAVLLHLLYANLPEEEKTELAEAKKITQTISDPLVQQRASASILEFEAARQCASYYASLGKNPGVTDAQNAAFAAEPLTAMIAAKTARDQVLQPNPLAPATKETNPKDLDTKELLERINQMSSTSLVKFAKQLNPIQKKNLLTNLTSAPSVEFRRHLIKLSNAIIKAAGDDPKQAATKKARARIAHDCLKPFYVFTDSELSAMGLKEFKESNQNNLDRFESQLKAAGDKFEVFAGP